MLPTPPGLNTSPTLMVSREPASQNSPRPSMPRNAPSNGENHQNRSNDGRCEDVETGRSRSPTRNSSNSRARRPRLEFVASQPGSMRKRHRQLPQSTRRGYVEYPKSDSDVGEARESAELEIQQQLTGEARKYAIAVFKYTIEVVADSFRLYRWLFSYALGILILGILFSMIASQLILFAQPICSLPIISPVIPFCRWDVFKGPPAHTSDGQPIRWADYPKLVDMQTKTFDQLLDESVGNKGLALEVRKAEMASSDLITLVRASDLKSRDQVSERLGRFMEDARGTGRSLHSLGAKIHGAVDSITNLNDYALQTIEASNVPPSLVARLLPFSLTTTDSTKEAVLKVFFMSMDNVAGHMVRLREEAEISMGHLLRLEEHLVVLHEITHRDGMDLTAAREDVLAELWTWLGGNKHKLRRMDHNLNLLKNIDKDRRKALAHVAMTLQTLHTLDVDMEELRTRVAAPDIIGDKIPIEVHIKSIKDSVKRLKEGQLRASFKEREIVAKVLEIGA